ncbi:MAG TPA: transglycosylase domain-containing protein [Ramlibacter sp.]|jgi:penicillin-binding protein 1A|uniref:penicillin-binding protein 1A n=1 Tax=Ramlibacter sp. TaxID=1917967 RepID=UPI002D4AAC36|nr:transglycosylase domain-containing protein [Ramlibacter sp.]HZY16836.1 transglycosylase domain-containing protein [Ramlibacter sp.]
MPPPALSAFAALRAWPRAVGRWTWWLLRNHWLLLLSTLPLLALALAAAYVAALVPRTPDVGDMREVRAQQPSQIVSSDGQTLAVLRRANRQWVPLADISPHVLAALLATEDHRFYEHHGLDVRRTVSAALHTLNGRLQGGSTLTQQLARNLYPEEIGRAPTLERKLKEAITAVRIEAAFGKDEILETYLNTVPFLYNAYGIEMAARTYFDKAARDLDVLESATLVGMLKGTSYYNPVLNPERARQRRNTVLAQMARHGKLDGTQLAALRQTPLRLTFERQEEEPGLAPHFVVQVRRWLIDWADRNGRDVYADGLVVRTTIDSRAQALAVEALQRQTERVQKLADTAWNGRAGWNARRDLVDAFIRESAQFQAARAAGLSADDALAKLRGDAAFLQALREEKTRVQAGLVAIEPGTGLVRAWVGSRDFAQDQFDHVQQARRQPGSTFKPFVYGAAFAQGARPGEMLLDQVTDIVIGPGEVWRPTDVGQPTGAPMTLRDALAFSKNTITAQVMQRLGPQPVAALARAAGVRESRLDEVASLGLGTSPVSLKEMVAGYATIANGGRYVAPLGVSRVEDRQGRVLEAFPVAPAEEALPLVPNLELLDAMRGVIDRGTGTAIRTRYGLQGDLAGKTGTTQDNTDGWFILMHPQLVAGAWVGFNDSRITMQDAWGQGARSALPMVGEFVQGALRQRLIDGKARFPRPTDPELAEEVAAWWANFAPPPQQELATVPLTSQPLAVPEVVAVPAEPSAAVPPPQMETWPPAPSRAVVVAPPRGALPQAAAPAEIPQVVVAPSAPAPRAVVVAPPRPATTVQPAMVSPGPPGEASGAARAPGVPAWSVPGDPYGGAQERGR